MPLAAIPPDLAVARERFLTAESVEPHQVRPSILASWWRSRRANVAADRIRLDYIRDPDLDSPLTHSALPTLRMLRENLDGQPISIILTDAKGVVLTRLVADPQLDRHLDRVQLAPGFSYSEASVGTNGIGTALEGGRPMHVFGHEHYAENLEDLACAGVPIHHPISGKTVGAVDLTCWRRDAGPLLISLAKTTADQIRQALLVDGGVGEVALLQEYLRACRRTAGIVFAFNTHTVMLNEYARHTLDPADQEMLVGFAIDAVARPHRGPIVVDLPTGRRARMYCRMVRDDDESAGGVAHVKLIDGDAPPVAAVAAPRPAALPGVVGSGALWLRACRQIDAACRDGAWMSVHGEPGVGKLTAVCGVYRSRHPAGHLRVLDADDPHMVAAAIAELAGGDVALVIRHVDRLDGRGRTTLAAALRAAALAGPPAGARWVVLTLDRGQNSGDLVDLLAMFPHRVELPPLRHHIADVAELVPFLLARLGTGGRLTCSPEATQMLARYAWPGNIEQLRAVLAAVARQRGAGVIQPADLPPECRTVSRRLLSPLESMERDAIAAGLVDHQGNKAKVAKALGMSRATIYRKIHEYGIVPDQP